MQDEDIRFLTRHAGLSGYELAGRSLLEGSTLWRRLVQNGLYEQADMKAMDGAFFAAISCQDVDAACELVSAAFGQNQSHDAAWLNSWFHVASINEANLGYRIADLIAENRLDQPIHPLAMSAVLGMLGKNGLDLAVRKPFVAKLHNQIDEVEITLNGLQDVIDKSTTASEEAQGELMDVARVYLGLGVTMHESADGLYSSPLSALLRSGDPDLLPAWIEMLVDEEHVQPEHLRECRMLSGLFDANVALFDAYFARRQIQSIAASAKTAARAIAP